MDRRPAGHGFGQIAFPHINETGIGDGSDHDRFRNSGNAHDRIARHQLRKEIGFGIQLVGRQNFLHLDLAGAKAGHRFIFGQHVDDQQVVLRPGRLPRNKQGRKGPKKEKAVDSAHVILLLHKGT